MKKVLALLLAASVTATGIAAEKGYSCSLGVKNPKAERSQTESGGTKGNTRNSTAVKTINESMSWPVRVSFSGKEIPDSAQIKLACTFVGTTDGKMGFLGQEKMDVTLNDKHVFEGEIKSPVAKMTKTTKKTTSGGNRGGNRRGGSRSSKIETEKKGDRIVGCIVQLLVGDTVEKVWVSNAQWKKAAQKTPLEEKDIFK